MLGLAHGGKSELANWRVNYPSVMNYAMSSVTTAPGSTTPISRIQYSNGVLSGLSPQSVLESHGLGPDINNPDKSFYETYLGFIFNYPVMSTGAIDWNYDGIVNTSPYKAFIDAPLCEERDECFRSLEKDKLEKSLSDIHSTYRYIHLAVWDPNGTNPELYVFYPNTAGNLTYRKLELLFDINIGLYYDWSSAIEIKDSTNSWSVPVTSQISSSYFPIGSSQRMYIGYRGVNNKMGLGYVYKNSSGSFSWQNYSGSPIIWEITSHITPNGNGVNSSVEYNQGPSLIIDTRVSPSLLRVFYIAKSSRTVFSRSIDNTGILSSELTVANTTGGGDLTSGVTPSPFIHPTESSALYLMASNNLSSNPNGVVLLRNSSASNLNFSEVYHPISSSISMFSIYPNTLPVRPDHPFYLEKVSFNWQPSVIVDTISGHPPRVHFLYKSEHDKPNTTNPSENLSHAISSVHKNSISPPISWPGNYPFWFQRRSAATKSIGISTNRHISPSVSIYSNILEGKHVVGAYLEVEGSQTPKLHYIPYLDGLHNRTIPDHNDWNAISDYMCVRVADAKININGAQYLVGAGTGICAYSSVPSGASGPGPSISVINRRRKHLKKIDQTPCKLGRLMEKQRKRSKRGK